MKYILLFLISQALYAGGSHHEHTVILNSPNTTTTGRSEGVASSIAASQHHFDFGTHSWQGSIGAGSFSGQGAISFGVAKRLDRVLVNGSFGTEGDKSGFGVGVNWRF